MLLLFGFPTSNHTTSSIKNLVFGALSSRFSLIERDIAEWCAIWILTRLSDGHCLPIGRQNTSRMSNLPIAFEAGTVQLLFVDPRHGNSVGNDRIFIGILLSIGDGIVGGAQLLSIGCCPMNGEAVAGFVGGDGVSATGWWLAKFVAGLIGNEFPGTKEAIWFHHKKYYPCLHAVSKMAGFD